jgi:hypothetical protein
MQAWGWRYEQSLCYALLPHQMLRNHSLKGSRENRVNQSGSVGLSTEAMRGPP